MYFVSLLLLIFSLAGCDLADEKAKNQRSEAPGAGPICLCPGETSGSGGTVASNQGETISQCLSCPPPSTSPAVSSQSLQIRGLGFLQEKNELQITVADLPYSSGKSCESMAEQWQARVECSEPDGPVARCAVRADFLFGLNSSNQARLASPEPPASSCKTTYPLAELGIQLEEVVFAVAGEGRLLVDTAAGTSLRLGNEVTPKQVHYTASTGNLTLDTGLSGSSSCGPQLEVTIEGCKASESDTPQEYDCNLRFLDTKWDWWSVENEDGTNRVCTDDIQGYAASLGGFRELIPSDAVKVNVSINGEYAVEVGLDEDLAYEL